MHFQGNVEVRVLVVDDEAVIADSLVMILKRSGYSAAAAYSGEMAIRVASEWRPAVLVSDVVMPGISGLEAARAILELLPDCRVILFSGHGTLGHFAQTDQWTPEILAKPVHPEVLLRRLAELKDQDAGTPDETTPERCRSN